MCMCAYVQDIHKLITLCHIIFDSRKHANDMIVNLSYERDRLSQLVKEEEEEMKRLSDILRIVEV